MCTCVHVHIHTCPTLDATVAELSLVMVSYISLKTEDRRMPHVQINHFQCKAVGCGSVYVRAPALGLTGPKQDRAAVLYIFY